MHSKSQRLLTIKKIIHSQKIGNQEELLEALKNEGFVFTQATLSRDLKCLKVNRVADSEKGYVYTLPEDINRQDLQHGQDVFPMNQIESLDFSMNIAVIKTRPGHASSVATTIDEASLHEILGSIAGDDTIMIIMKENIRQIDLINALSKIIPGIENKQKKQ